MAEPLPPIPAAVVHPVDKTSLSSAVEAYKDNLIEPVFIGPEFKIRAVAEAEEIDLNGFAIVPVNHSHAAAEKAAQMAKTGEVRLIMKGTLSSDELLDSIPERSLPFVPIGALHTCMRWISLPFPERCS